MLGEDCVYDPMFLDVALATTHLAGSLHQPLGYVDLQKEAVGLALSFWKEVHWWLLALGEWRLPYSYR